jgi:molybdopterin synthase sulfur carrier subunit
VSSQVTVRYWAGARRAAGLESEQFQVTTLAELRALLSARPALADVMSASSILVDSVARGEDAPLHDGAVIDVLPPFAGG